MLVQPGLTPMRSNDQASEHSRLPNPPPPVRARAAPIRRGLPPAMQQLIQRTPKKLLPSPCL
eukprot:6187539-Pyramimonas_sp.AAC.1